MFSRQTIATVSGLIGGLAVICVGAAQAYADESPGECKTSSLGDTICVRKSETVKKDKEGKYFVKQTQDCSTIDRPRLVFPDDNLLSDGSSGSTNAGPVVECSNKAQLPKGLKVPHPRF
ncbi:hypothetical protein ACIRU3_04840 [Streptomyces sp. NPDC101151]|uniref:hypothetical protein n=1 Tax=Streptomyces sp. NPDC101151 TaxID=3366115 RepID=UPI003811A7C0